MPTARMVIWWTPRNLARLNRIQVIPAPRSSERTTRIVWGYCSGPSPSMSWRVRIVGSAAADRHAARSRGDPEAPRASEDGFLRAEPRPRPARVLIGAARARRAPSCLCREASFLLIRPVHLPLDSGGLRAWCPAHSRAGRGGRARRLMCAVPAGCSSGGAACGGWGRVGLGTGRRGEGAEGVDVGFARQVLEDRRQRFFRIGLRREISASAASTPVSYSSLNR
jgi:hypothetical protein